MDLVGDSETLVNNLRVRGIASRNTAFFKIKFLGQGRRKDQFILVDFLLL
jgi:hypothetical protein